MRNARLGGTFVAMIKGAKISRPKNIAGAVARGADFWGREAEVEELWRVLTRGSTLLSAPRRWGKSSLMWALRDAPRAGWTVVDLDVEYVETPIEFLTELTAALLQQDAFSRLFKSAKKAPGALMRWISGAVDEVGVGELKFKLRAGLEKQDNWHDLAEQLLGYMRNVEGQLLVIIDEFPMMISNFLDDDEEGGLHFLKWFRAQRVGQKAPNTRFLLGGSVNIEPRLEQLASEALLNDLERFYLIPMEEERTIAFVTAILSGEDAVFEDAVPAEIARTIGTGVHFYLQVLISECLADARRKGTTLNAIEIKPIYDSRVLGPAGRARFSHYHSRLKMHYGLHEEPARIVLAELTSSDGRTIEQLHFALTQRGQSETDIDRLVAMLEGDYYVSREADRVVFSSRFLRDWWFRNAPGPRRRP